MERTLVLVKPDGVQRGLIGEVITRLEQRGLRLVAAKFTQASWELAEKHYYEHHERSFYTTLLNYITSGPVMAMVWEAPNAIKAVRQMMGSTNPLEAEAGSIRHDFCLEIGRNLTHASDSVEKAEAEIALWFSPEEIIQWERSADKWIFDLNRNTR